MVQHHSEAGRAVRRQIRREPAFLGCFSVHFQFILPPFSDSVLYFIAVVPEYVTQVWRAR